MLPRPPRRCTHNILDGLIVGCDGTEGWCNDGLVERNEEDAHAQGQDDEDELESRRILDSGIIVVRAAGVSILV